MLHGSEAGQHRYNRCAVQPFADDPSYRYVHDGPKVESACCCLKAHQKSLLPVLMLELTD